MKQLLERLHRRLRLPGRMALASIALLGILSTQGASAATAGGGGKFTGSGSAQSIQGVDNLFGWHVGDVTVTQQFICIDCNCTFTGSVTLAESLPIQSCRIVNEMTIPTSCGGTSSENCPGGVTGQAKSITYECCLSYFEVVLCFSQTTTIFSCP